MHGGLWVSAFVDYVWAALGILLRPLVRTHGMIERRCWARALRLDPPRFSVEMRPVDTCTVDNGRTVLRGTLWLPSGCGASGPFPTVILRSPYGAQAKHGRTATFPDWGQILLAERGYAVLFQDTRGRFGSDGSFVPVEHEREDGAATVRWSRAQPWCDGRIAVFGPSYLGLTAWACVGGCAPGELQAAIPGITQAVVRPAVFAGGGAIALELLVLWFYLIEVIAHATALQKCAAMVRDFRRGRLGKAMMHEPLGELDQLLFGRTWDFFQRGVAEPFAEDGPFWKQRSTLCELRREHEGCVTPPPLHIISGWHDFFVRQSLVDYERAAHLQPSARLTVTPFSHWGHMTLGGVQLMYRALFECLDSQMPPTGAAAPAGARSRHAAHPHRRPLPPLPWLEAGRPASCLAQPVQLCFAGSLRWRGFASWPPKPSHEGRLWPTPTGGLGWTLAGPDPFPIGAGTVGAWHGAAAPAGIVGYAYHPDEPTPAAGGPSFDPLNSGTANQARIEARADVLVFTTTPLDAPLVLAGNVSLQLRVWATARSVDVVGRLCIVRRGGKSINICEVRVRPDGDCSWPLPRPNPNPPASRPPLPSTPTRTQPLSQSTTAARSCPSPPSPCPCAALPQGLTRVDAAVDEPSIGAADEARGRLVSVHLGPIAAELARGERLRLHVCSSAHPRWMRNLCSDPEVPLAQQRSRGVACRVQLGIGHPDSVLVLPLLPSSR